ncbi:MAG: hypothetical protein P1T08_12700 [Acidimicrobiia bacterium]|nr:hypothetical protein [Acidimicrobiia bacterium]
MAHDLRKMVDRLLVKDADTTLERFLRESRHNGSSYESMSQDLHLITQGAVAVTASTVRRWCADLEEPSEVAS